MTNEEKLCKYLTIAIGNVYGAMGLAGNVRAEAGENFDNGIMEIKYQKELGITSKQYVSDINARKYTKQQFMYDKIGYGLYQATWWELKKDMYEHFEIECAKLNIPFDISNFDIACTDLTRAITKAGLMKKLAENEADIYTAAKLVCTDFERPAGKDDPNTWGLRATYGAECFKHVFNLNPNAEFEFDGKIYRLNNGRVIR